MSQHTILISIGSNIEREHYTKQSLVALKQHFSDVTVSSVYESEAVGFNGSPFYNAAARATTSKSIKEVCAILKAIEKDNGRAAAPYFRPQPGSRRRRSSVATRGSLLFAQKRSKSGRPSRHRVPAKSAIARRKPGRDRRFRPPIRPRSRRRFPSNTRCWCRPAGTKEVRK